MNEMNTNFFTMRHSTAIISTRQKPPARYAGAAFHLIPVRKNTRLISVGPRIKQTHGTNAARQSEMLVGWSSAQHWRARLAADGVRAVAVQGYVGDGAALRGALVLGCCHPAAVVVPVCVEVHPQPVATLWIHPGEQ